MYIQPTPTDVGAYTSPQSSAARGLVQFPDAFLDTFLAYNGFVTLTIENNTVTAIEPNAEAWEAWKAEQPEPVEPEPTPQEDTDAMLVDHEYRITLLELGVTNDAV